MLKIIYIGKDYSYAIKDDRIYLINNIEYKSGFKGNPLEPAYNEFYIGQEVLDDNCSLIDIPIKELKEIIYNKI